MDELAKLIDALAKLVGAVVWPSFAIFVIWHFGPSLRVFLENISEASFKGMGIEASAKLREAVTAVATAQIAKTEPVSSGAPAPTTPERVAASLATANSLVTRGTLRRLSGKRILWVDDHPDNNLWERNALEAMGVRVTPVLSTESALYTLKGFGGAYDLIISDMTRGSDKAAGYDLLSQLRREGRDNPFIIYAGSANSEQKRAAIEKGANGRASDPETLIRLVTESLVAAA